MTTPSPDPAPHRPDAARASTVVVVEDDASVRDMIAMVLERAGFAVATAPDGTGGLDQAAGGDADLVVLDLMIPWPDGFEVLRRLRRTSAVPVLVLTARTDTADVVTALELGADDYVTKPFEPAELVARARALVRRASHDVTTTVTLGDLVIDQRAFRARRGDDELALTPIEFRLLAELATHRGEALTRDALLRHVWGYDYLGDSRLVDMAIQRLRAKIGDPPSDPRYIQTVRGVGYRIDTP